MGMDVRDDRGRFGIGNSASPGRPPRKTEQAFLRAMVASISMEDWISIVKKATSDAKLGDAAARQWLSRHVLGDPAHKAPTPREIEILDASGAEEAVFQTSVLYAQINAKS
jgi:hypothetical protein